MTGLYIAWTAIGHQLTGRYIYPYFDPSVVGSRGIITAICTLMALVTSTFLLQLGLHDLREHIVGKADCERNGRQ